LVDFVAKGLLIQSPDQGMSHNDKVSPARAMLSLFKIDIVISTTRSLRGRLFNARTLLDAPGRYSMRGRSADFDRRSGYPHQTLDAFS
jgi:hypothetical protein